MHSDMLALNPCSLPLHLSSPQPSPISQDLCLCLEALPLAHAHAWARKDCAAHPYLVRTDCTIETLRMRLRMDMHIVKCTSKANPSQWHVVSARAAHNADGMVMLL